MIAILSDINMQGDGRPSCWARSKSVSPISRSWLQRLSGDLQTAANRAAADILIHPELAPIDMWSFRALDKAIEADWRVAAAGIERLKQGLVVETPKWANFWR